MKISIEVQYLQRGDVVEQFTYHSGEKLPLTVTNVARAKQHGYVIVEGIDADGNRVIVPAGHKSNVVQMRSRL